MTSKISPSTTRRFLRAYLYILLAVGLVIGMVMPAFAQGSTPDTGADSAKSQPAREQEAEVTYFVRFAPGLASSGRRNVLSSAGASEISDIPQLNLRVVKLSANNHAAKATALAHNPNVVSVERVLARSIATIPDDTEYAQQWALPKVGWDQAYGVIAPAGTAIVAVLDTGIDGTHPDLVNKVVPGISILDNTSDGLSDPNGHGTRMAGIVAAETGNGIGVAGIAYAGVQVMPIVVLGADGTGQDSDIVAGVTEAVTRGADVILMGFSNPGMSPALQDAINYAWDNGVVLVAATGNNSSMEPTSPPVWPV